jgi:hypothetical protein
MVAETTEVEAVQTALVIVALSEVVEAARVYVSAVHDAHEASGSRMLEAWVGRDWAFHELVLALGIECWLCDPGTCPGAPGKVLPTYDGRPVTLTEPL